jgi:hypothetical protein
MAYTNGRIPASALAPIPGTSSRTGGHPLLRKDAARAYTALHRYSMKRWGISMALSEGSIRRAYRELAAQIEARRYWCGLGKCANAATPGTSNHGLGITVDLMTRQQRWVIDQVGASFGFSKQWSDASWEWWHIGYRPDHYEMVEKYSPSKKYPVLHRGTNGPAVKRLKKLLYHHGIRHFSGTRLAPSNNRFKDHFGANTKRAVKRFQKKHGLKADGVVGHKTWQKLRGK